MRLLLMTLLSFTISGVWADTLEGKVVTVINGDTFEILTKDKEKVKVMLFNADSPELGQEFGKEAKSFVEKLLLKKKVKVVMKGKDRWGNKLAQIKLKNGDDLSEKMIKAGFAWVGLKHQKLNSLKSLENSAKNKSLGLWQGADFVSPWVYRRKQTMLQAKSR